MVLAGPPGHHPDPSGASLTGIDDPSIPRVAGGVGAWGLPPEITEETARFWQAAQEGELLIERCVACGFEIFPPRGVCRSCGSRLVEWFQVCGPGVVYSCTVNHQVWAPDMKVPFGLALVEFPGHPSFRVLGHVAPEDLTALEIGTEVDLVFLPGPTGLRIPGFRPRGEERSK